MSQPDTKERILDAAERLFAEEGFHNTSLRALTGAAGVNLAAVNYHFGAKEGLMEAIIERRLDPLNRTRREALEAMRKTARRDGTPPPVREVFRAFVEPTLRFRDSGPGARDFITLVGRFMAEPDDTIRKIFLRRMEPLFSLMLNVLEESLPDFPRDLLFWRLHLALGAIAHTLCLSGRVDVLPPGMSLPPSDALVEMLLDFLTSGMKAGQ